MRTGAILPALHEKTGVRIHKLPTLTDIFSEVLSGGGEAVHPRAAAVRTGVMRNTVGVLGTASICVTSTVLQKNAEQGGYQFTRQEPVSFGTSCPLSGY